MKNKQFGFTLLEILIALFIFTVLSLIMVGALHTVINAQSGSENKAERLRQLQLVLLVMSRDIEQAINRPIVNSDGREEAAFVGTLKSFQFTHTGFANPLGNLPRSNLQRTGYAWDDKNRIYRLTWPVLDQTPKSQPDQRWLLSNVEDAHFQYLDHEGKFHDKWPVEDKSDEPLPRGVRIYLTIAKWGEMTQLYLVPVQKKENPAPPNPDGNNGKPDKIGK